MTAGDNKLPSNRRLRDKPSLDCVFDSRKKINSFFFALRYRKNDQQFSRLGVIVGKRNVRLSVNRNRIRRIIREQFRTHLVKNAGYDLIFIGYKQANEARNDELRSCIEQLFNTLVNASQRP